MDGSAKDIAFNAVQRDRLSEMFKHIDETHSGCFYQSLVNVYHYLNPGKMLPRSFEKVVLERNPTLDLSWDNVIPEIDALKDLLHLKVLKLEVLPGPLDSKMQAKTIVDARVPVEEIHEMVIKTGDDFAAIVCWRKKAGGETHASSTVVSTMLWHEYRGKGGLEEQLLLQYQDFIPSFVFYLGKASDDGEATAAA